MTTAAVCKSGHIVSNDVVDASNRVQIDEHRSGSASVFSPDVPRQQSRANASQVQGFCGICGLPVMTVCENCKAALPKPNYQAGERDAYAFCVKCGEPFPWATRAQQINKLQNLLDLEKGLTKSNRLDLVEAIGILAQPEDSDTFASHIKAGERIRKLAPSVWQLAQPILTSVLSAELQQALHLPH
jgi:hypothetical protein